VSVREVFILSVLLPHFVSFFRTTNTPTVVNMPRSYILLAEWGTSHLLLKVSGLIREACSVKRVQ